MTPRYWYLLFPVHGIPSSSHSRCYPLPTRLFASSVSGILYVSRSYILSFIRRCLLPRLSASMQLGFISTSCGKRSSFLLKPYTPSSGSPWGSYLSDCFARKLCAWGVTCILLLLHATPGVLPLFIPRKSSTYKAWMSQPSISRSYKATS
ncbi:hypothetical protein BXZ70DRAFT_402465 [Cristinia sonorae]|uniref:Uncharacterized protein n=1 Tax=Cristinia sonorae TaxID=1940300 RepID=A0A8K0XTR2_9AGAR|nr:hypothetical protein BXZ70DRAFT_402465 [Cristinia sonorae]